MRRFVFVLGFLWSAAPALSAAEGAMPPLLVGDTTTQSGAMGTALQKSVHSSLGCADCHVEKMKSVDCASCHADAVAAWETSLHAKAVKSGSARGARCLDCHGPAHEILPSSDSKSRTFHKNAAATCSRCHAQTFVMEKAGLSAQPANSYRQSVHGRASANGNAKAANCVDCHDSHAVLPANNPQSPIFKFNVARTCGRCHAGIGAQYVSSVHGKALARGNGSAPVCTDCHGIHTISKATDSVRGPRASCANCHDGVRLNREFAVASDRVSTYQHSYHGLARQMGSQVAADCASCHGSHDVLPSSDPKSAVNKANLQKTCGKCHRDAKENFTVGQIHLGGGGGPTDPPTRAVEFIKWIYIALISMTVGFMVLHNAIVWFRKAQLKRRDPDRTVVRMNLNQRFQHAIMGLSFVVLVISGFALAWPNSFFAWFFGPGEELRRIVHRVAAIVMIAIGLYHLAYMTFTREGRKGLRDLWVNFKDGKDVYGVLKYYLGLSKTRPEFGRFSYAEKMEYWAGLWGTIVMAVTGLVIWYSVTVATWVPRWWVDIATTIHFWEAILATLAILVWHIYHVVFDPDVYPMNWAWFDGKMSSKLYKHEHGLETAEDSVPTTKPKTVIGKELEQGA